jgi:ribosome-binding ATPase YchF (GTP1/OBG family)
MTDKLTAIISLVPNAEVSVRGEEVEWHNPSTPVVTDAQIEAEIARLQAEYEAKEYQRQRAKEYPSIQDQLDTLYHGGYDAWKATITAVKEEFPKP